MSVNYSTAVRIAMLDVIESTVGGNARIRFYSGTKPSVCSDASTGTLLATMALTGAGGDWMSAASAAGNVVTKAKNPSSTWTTTGAAAGNIGYYRIYDASETVCHEQGTVTATGGGGDMTVDNVTIAIGQALTITGKTITAGNA